MGAVEQAAPPVVGGSGLTEAEADDLYRRQDVPLVDGDIPGGVARDSEVTAAVGAEAVLARNADNLTSGTVADARIASTIARDSEVTAAVAAEAVLARNADNLTSGTVADARIPAAIARDTEVASAVAAEATARDTAIAAAIAALVAAAPGTLDTLGEIATALGSDPNLATTLAASIATKFAAAGHDVNSIVASIAGTLADLDIPSSTFVGRKAAGNVVPMTVAEAKTLLALVKGDVGLSNVDNTADTAKPVSTAQQAALDLKAPLASPALTGTPAAPTAAQGTNTTQVATTAYVQTEVGLLVPKSVLTTNGDLLTRAAGVPARLTRASLAADTAFTSVFAPIPVRDTAANLAAANTVYATGVLVVATDTGVLAYGDGATAYNSLVKYQPRNTAMIQSTTSLTTQSAVGTAGADWSGLTITLTADGVTAIRLHAHCGEITDSLLGGKARMVIQEGASVITRQDSGEARANGSAVGGIDFWCPSFIPTSGSHTYKVVVASILSTSTATFTAGSADPALLESVLA